MPDPALTWTVLAVVWGIMIYDAAFKRGKRAGAAEERARAAKERR